MRRLAEACSGGALTLSSITTFLLPLAAQVIFGVQSNAEQNLVAEAVGVVGAVAKWMKWSLSSLVHVEALHEATTGLHQVSPECICEGMCVYVGGCVCGCPIVFTLLFLLR